MTELNFNFSFSDLETRLEIWNFDSEYNNIINPTLPEGHYYDGVGLYVVSFDFCTLNDQ